MIGGVAAADLAGGADHHHQARSQSTATRYKYTEKKPVPRLGGSELNERVIKYPLSKNELVDYLIKIQSSNQVIAKSTY